MKLLFTAGVLLAWASAAVAHPLHLSITNITLENGLLKVNMKTFRDDWETAYFHYHGKQIDFSDQESRQEPWFVDYMEESFRLSFSEDGQLLELILDTVLLEENSMTLELHTKVRGVPKSLYIYNALLTDIYPDQTNLVIFGFKNQETGIKFDVKKHSEAVSLRKGD